MKKPFDFLEWMTFLFIAVTSMGELGAVAADQSLHINTTSLRQNGVEFVNFPEHFHTDTLFKIIIITPKYTFELQTI